MAQTVIGIFERNSQVQDAVARLTKRNVDRSDIDIAVPDAAESRGDITDERHMLGTRIGNYFSKLFSDSNDALRYTAVAQRGIVMAVHTENYDDAERVADILDDCGALNIDEAARTLEDSMTREDRKYNLKEGSPEVNTPAPDFNTRRSSNIAAETERQVSPDKRAKPSLRMRTRIVESTFGADYRVREERIRFERPAHDRVDEQGKIHKDGL